MNSIYSLFYKGCMSEGFASGGNEPFIYLSVESFILCVAYKSMCMVKKMKG